MNIPDLTIKIFQFLDFQSLVQCRKVNKQFVHDDFQPSAIYHADVTDILRTGKNMYETHHVIYHLSRFSHCKCINFNVEIDDISHTMTLLGIRTGTRKMLCMNSNNCDNVIIGNKNDDDNNYTTGDIKLKSITS